MVEHASCQTGTRGLTLLPDCRDTGMRPVLLRILVADSDIAVGVFEHTQECLLPLGGL